MTVVGARKNGTANKTDARISTMKTSREWSKRMLDEMTIPGLPPRFVSVLDDQNCPCIFAVDEIILIEALDPEGCALEIHLKNGVSFITAADDGDTFENVLSLLQVDQRLEPGKDD